MGDIDISAQLKEHLIKGEDWEKMETPIPGVFIVKIPESKTLKALLNLELNPLKDDGKSIKRKGLFINSKEMFVKFTELFLDDQAFQIIQEMEQINVGQKGSKAESKKLEM